MTDNIRHGLINAIVVIKRLTKSSKSTVEKLIDSHSTLKTTTDTTTIAQLKTLKQSLSMLEEETNKLSEICGNIIIIEKDA